MMKNEYQIHLITPTQREQEDTLLALGESELGDLILGAQDRAIISQIKKERKLANEEGK
jgi:hypothetical protein